MAEKMQEGGWYGGRRYIGGTLLPAGQDQPGHFVSAEVNAQSAKAQGKTVEQFNAYLGAGGSAPALPTTPTSADQVTPFLNDYQSSLFGAATSPETKGIPTMADLKAKLAPTTPAPAPISRVETRQALNTQYGVADLEASLNDLKAQEDELVAATRQQGTAERGKTVPMNVIEGRITEEQRIASEKMDYIVRQKNSLVNELNTKYRLIDQVIQDTGLDYQDAVARYDKEFAQNLQMFDVIRGYERDAQDQANKDRDFAQSNLTIMTNLITSGNMNYSSLPAESKLMVSKLEVQSGLPVGTVASLQLSPKDRILGWSEDKTQAMVVGTDGKMTVINTGMRKSTGTGTAAERTATQKKSDYAEMDNILRILGGEDKVVSGQQWNEARRDWVLRGYDVKEFNNAFKGYANTKWDKYIGYDTTTKKWE
ncbi:MAG: hypothetical protein NUV73_00170 [Candidatus Daviesbacteria bacterium]|nr:hypothetical protein [Candidatus Daviesbacteria bacterium]